MPRTIPRHFVTRCLAVENKASGFYANHHPGGGDWIHNSAFGNNVNFNFLGRDMESRRDLPGFGHVVSNNLSFGGRHQVQNLDREKCELTGNIFGESISQKDFVSLDPATLTTPRLPDGSLPEIEFMRPVAGGVIAAMNPGPGAFEGGPKGAAGR